jgi:PAS domain S-box-containing protein
MIKDKKPYRILVMEDNPGDFIIVEDFLMEQMQDPFIVNTVSFKQAFEIFSTAGNTYDVILLDLSLPDKSGQSLVIEMLRIASSCPIIILTGFADIDFSIKSISHGILDYLLKDDLTADKLYKSIIYSIERKKTIIQLKESEKRYSDLFHLSPQPMWVFDAETFRFVQVNKATIALYGYSEEEFLNMTLMDIKQEEDILKATEHLRKGNPGADIFKQAVMHHKKSGEIIEVEIYSTPIIINEKSFRSVIAIDVTEIRQYEHKIIKAIIKTQEDERYEIGGELHDNVCQILAGSLLSLGMLKESLAPPGMQWLDQCRKYIGMAAEEIRNLSHRLAPAFFDESTLEEAFGLLLNAFNMEQKYTVSLHFDDALQQYPVSLELQLNLYRILQEQLKNILKYSKATLIEVDVLIHNKKLKMRVSDNGVGFDTAAVKGGIGLANMKRRAELFSGKCEVNSSPGYGCITVIDIPLQGIN